jgi:His/Glu/Gln/Arg/opine family amino acid ABC transporter permease subunit
LKSESKYSVIRPSKSNVGWWILAFLLFLCGIGIIYEILVNRLGWDYFGFETFGWDLPLFGGQRAYYFDIIMVFINVIFYALSIFNPILEIVDIISPFSLQFSPVFTAGDRWVTIIQALADAAIITLQISLSSIAIGFFIGIFLAIILVRPGRVFGLKVLAQSYIDFFRSTPLLVQLFIIFFGIPPMIQGLDIPGFERFTFSYIQAAVIGLSLNTAAYQAEIIRGGILAIPTGQTEAARALGLTSTQTMRFVILPQALRIIIPPFTNEGINIILNSSLASAISTWELTRAARNLSAFYYLAFEIYMAAALFYFVMAYSLARLTKKLEIRFRIPGLGIHHD